MKKILKNISLFIGFILLVILIFNYRVYNRINLNINTIELYKTTNNIESITYDINQIYTNQIGGCQKKTSSERNVCSFTLNFNFNDEEIHSFVIELDNTKVNSNQILIQTHTNNKKYLYGVNDFYVNKSTNKELILNKKNINRLDLFVEGEVDKNQSFRDILNIKEIRINDYNDINKLKRNIIYELVLSIIYTSLLYIFIFLLFKSKIDKKINLKLETTFLIIGLVSGCLFSFLFPLYQIPDEITHINWIYEDLGINLDFHETTNNFGDTKKISGYYNEKVDYNKYFDLSKKINISPNFKVQRIRLITHLPQAIGIYLGTILNLPILVTITISELLAVFFYVTVCYYALKLIPFKKEIFMMIMLLPIGIQQIGTFSYDVILNATSFLFIAYLLHLKFTKKEIVLLDILKLIGLLLIIFIIKIPYVLGSLLLLLPISKLNLDFKIFKINELVIKKNYKKILIILSIIFIPLLILIFKIFNTFSYGRIFIASILGNFQTLKLLFNTFLQNWSTYLIQLVGNFGWLEIPVSLLFMVFILTSVFLFSFFNKKESKLKEIKFKKWEIIYIYTIVIILSCLIILSMFTYTLSIYNIEDYFNLSVLEYVDLFKQINIIEGVQGRYFIPILPLLLLPLSSKFINNLINKFNYKFYLLIYYSIIIIYMFFIILNRYWIL